RFGMAVQISDQLSGPPLDQSLFGYAGAREAASNLVAFVDAALLFPLASLTLLLLLRVLLRRDLPAIVAVLLLLASLGLRPGVDPAGFIAWGLAGGLIFLLVVFRFGLLAFVVGVFVNIVLGAFPMTLSSSLWYSG